MKKLKLQEEITLNWDNDIKQALVSIQCLAYNHELFIEEALEGFLIQETNFPFEIIIHDDASSDSTADIIRKYEKKYPDIIKPIYQVENQFSQNKKQNVRDAINEKIQGKYIALCEGDDYWTDPLKLQKQVSFLEENEDVSIVHSDFDWLDNKSGNIIKNYFSYRQIKFSKKYDVIEYLLRPELRTLTVCFRKSDMNGYADIWQEDWTAGDIPLFLYLAREKKIAYINETMGVYRKLEESFSSAKDINTMYTFWKGTFATRFFFYDYLHLDNHKVKLDLIDQYNEQMFSFALFSNKYIEALKILLYKIVHLKLSKNNISVILSYCKSVFSNKLGLNR